MIALNYISRALIVLVGVLFVTGWSLPEGVDLSVVRTVGSAIVLLGIYRLARYHTLLRRFQREEASEQEREQESTEFQRPAEVNNHEKK